MTGFLGLVIDSFAGGGGASLGIERALGRPIDVAINHDAEAVAMHAANHPATRHYCQNIWRADPAEVCAGRRVGVAWFSPDCKHHSKAKGSRPVKRNIRDLAWVVVLWAKRARPRLIFLENVEEFRDWGPIDLDGRPIKDRKGETFARWVGELRRLGYRVEYRELRASDYGVPTIRKRLFLIARCDGRPIVWPRPTHGPTHGPGLLPVRTAASCIDWSIPCPSIFERTRPLAEATLRRIARGVVKYVIEAAEPFVVRNMTGNAAHGLDEPLPTTTAGGSGKSALVAAFMAQHNTGVTGHPMSAPVSTVTGRGTQQGLVAVALEKGETDVKRSDNGPVDNRARPDKGRSGRHRLADSRSKPWKEAGDPAEAGGMPLQERVPRSDDLAAQQAVLGAGSPASLDSAARPDPAGSRHQPQERNEGGQQPSQSGNSNAQRESEACVPNGAVEAPEETGPDASGQSGGTACRRDELRRRGESARDFADVGLSLGELVASFLTKFYGTAIGQDVGDPLHAATSKARFGVVTVQIGGVPYAIADIGMRMLAPRELFRAHGFPDSYVIDPPFNGKPLTKTAQYRMVGNSVCPDLAEILVKANVAAESAASAESGAAA